MDLYRYVLFEYCEADAYCDEVREYVTCYSYADSPQHLHDSVVYGCGSSSTDLVSFEVIDQLPDDAELQPL